MKLLKIIVFFFILYLIRRFFQAYKVMKAIHETNLRSQAQAQAEAARAQASTQTQSKNQTQQEVVDADFRVID